MNNHPPLEQYFRDLQHRLVESGDDPENILSPHLRRLGKFKVSSDVLDSKYFPEILQKMEFVPVRAETLWVNRCIEYIGFSPIFEENPPWGIIPDYTIIVNCDESGELKSVEAKKAEA